MTQNEQLLETLQAKYKLFLSYARKLCKDDHKAEDIVQSIALRLLNNPIEWEVLNNDKILYTMVWQVYCNSFRVSKRYVLMAVEDNESLSGLFDEIIQNRTPCKYMEDLEDSFNLRAAKKAALNLPKKQKEAILSGLDGTRICEEGGDYNTAKTHRRLGTIKLKEILCG